MITLRSETAEHAASAVGASEATAVEVRAPAAPLDVLLLSASGHMGGAERALLDVVAALRAREPRARIGVLLAATGPLEDAVRALGADALTLPFPRVVSALGDSAAARGAVSRIRVAAAAALAVPRALAYARALRDVLRRLRPAVLHSNGFKMHVLATLVAPRGAAVVWHMHDYIASRPLSRRLLMLLRSRCTLVVANSRSVAEDVRRTLGTAVRTVTVHNAVDLMRLTPDGPRAALDQLAGRLPPAVDVVRVGLVATLAWWKGHDVFLRAVARLPRDLRLRAYVVGGSVYETRGSEATLADLRSKAVELGIADRVGFTGFVADSASAMRALDIVVHASTRPEPFGLVIAEAMTLGRAVIRSDDGGAAELGHAEQELLIHRSGDDAALAAQIERLVTDHTLRSRLGEAARAYALAHFGRERLASELAPLYAEARRLARGGRS